MFHKERVTWTEIKTFASARQKTIQFVDRTTFYQLFVFDGQLCLECPLVKDNGTNHLDFENNYKTNANKSLDPKDSTGRTIVRHAATIAGWHYRLHGLQWKTCKKDSLKEIDDDGNPYSFGTLKFYNEAGTELTEQAEIESTENGAVKTVLFWEANHDIEPIGGIFKQPIAPATDVFMGCKGAPMIPYSLGGSRIFASGINLRMLSPSESLHLDGRAPKFMPYDPVYHTSQFKMTLLHDKGVQHETHLMWEFYRP